MPSKIHLAFITYNRIEYTRLSLASVLADPSEEFALTIWDNASTDGTVEYLKNEVSDPRIHEIVFSKENIGQTAAVNEVWGRSKADLLGKLDNDCLMPPGWTQILAQAHEDIADLGVVACWHFFPEDFDYERAKHKIQTFGRHRIFRHPWTCGTGLLLKQEDFRRFGPIQERATTQYWLKMALAGRINGFYYPLVHQEHMDDPKSEHCLIKDAASFRKYQDISFGLRTRRYGDIAGRMGYRQEIVRGLLDDTFDPRNYVGWKKKWRSVTQRFSRMFRKTIRGRLTQEPL